MCRSLLVFLLLTLGMHCEATDASLAEEKPMVIVIASYNNQKWSKRNLDSVFSQNYTNYRVIYVDDASLDNTATNVQQYIEKCGCQEQIQFIQNEKRSTALANLYKAINLCAPNEIVVLLDGDDWFANDSVLKRVNEEYADDNTWLSYGQFGYFIGENHPISTGFTTQISDDVIKNHSYRQSKWVTSHLRTFYAGLFHKIQEKDLKYDGDFFQSAYDVAIMMPMLEMASTHSRFIPDLLYIHNRCNPINDDKVNRQLQLTLDREIRSREKYQPISTYLPNKKVYISKGLWPDLFNTNDPVCQQR